MDATTAVKKQLANDHKPTPEEVREWLDRDLESILILVYEIRSNDAMMSALVDNLLVRFEKSVEQHGD
ncbi:MAG: hypothetical protein QXT77_07065 [Candidatus Methanomethylicaceae archaeon]